MAKELDARTDLFSLGLVLYEMATGRPAFTGTTGAIIAAAILHQDPPPPHAVRADLPEPLERVILKAVEKDRALRYQHASELRADLLRLKRDSESSGVAIIAERAGARPVARRWATVAVIIALAVAFLGATYAYFHRPPVSLTDKDTIVLADFKNTTGDEVFDETLRRGLAVQLEQSPFLSLVSDQRIRKTVGLMGRPVDARLTPEIAREVCERTGSAAVLEGSIATLGTQYALGLRASNCRTGDVLDEEQAQAGGRRTCWTRSVRSRRRSERASASRLPLWTSTLRRSRRRRHRRSRRCRRSVRLGRSTSLREPSPRFHCSGARPSSIRSSPSPTRTWGSVTARLGRRRSRPRTPRGCTNCGIAPAIRNASSSPPCTTGR